MIEQLATLAYGVLAIIAALILSSQVGSPTATTLAFVAAGLAYVFQTVLLDGYRGPVLVAAWAGSVGALLASAIVSLWSAF